MHNIAFSTILEQANSSISSLYHRICSHICFESIDILFSEMNSLLHRITDQLWNYLLHTILSDTDFLSHLRVYGGRKGMRFQSYQRVSVVLSSGTRIQLTSPFFVMSRSRRGPKKRGPQHRGSHLGLEVLGFFDRMSESLVYKAIQLSVLTPSFAVASKVLEQDGVTMSANKLRSLCKNFGESLFSKRVDIVFDDIQDDCTNKRVLIEVDGGRLRQRKSKRGVKPQGNKLQGYYTDWKEPKMFVINIIDDTGTIVKKSLPFVDGSTAPVTGFITLLRQYLTTLKIDTAAEVILIGDGAPWIWERIPPLLEQLKVPKQNIIQIIDWTHAKQNLFEVWEMIPQKKKKQMDIQSFKDMLYNGSIEEMITAMKKQVQVKNKSVIAKKLHSYFRNNKERMQYSTARNKNRPIGSGLIESALRRVVNLRLKACGTFWKLPFAEIMLYLRAQILYGRWNNIVKNIKNNTQYQFVNTKGKKAA